MIDEPENVNDQQGQTNYLAGDEPDIADIADDGPEVVVPSWEVSWQPGLDAYLRNIVDPIFNQLGGLTRITEMAAAAMPRFRLPTIDFPELRLLPEISRSSIDINEVLKPINEALSAMMALRV